MRGNVKAVKAGFLRFVNSALVKCCLGVMMFRFRFLNIFILFYRGFCGVG